MGSACHHVCFDCWWSIEKQEDGRVVVTFVPHAVNISYFVEMKEHDRDMTPCNVSEGRTFTRLHRVITSHHTYNRIGHECVHSLFSEILSTVSVHSFRYVCDDEGYSLCVAIFYNPIVGGEALRGAIGVGSIGVENRTRDLPNTRPRLSVLSWL